MYQCNRVHSRMKQIMTSFLLWRKICLAHKENVFRYFNIVFCTFDTIIYCLVYEKRLVKSKYNTNDAVDWSVVSGIILQVVRYLLSWMLFFSIKYEQRKIVRLWCYLDVLLLVTLLIFILTNFLHIIPFYYVVLIFSCLIRVYGFWIVYSFSLDTAVDIAQPKVYYVKKEEKVSATANMKNNNLANCPSCSDSIDGNSISLSTSLSSLNSSRYYIPPV